MGEAEGPLNGGQGSWLFSARRSFLDVVLTRGADSAIPHYADVVGRLEYALSPAHRVELLGVDAVDDVLVDSADPTHRLRDDQASALVGLSVRSQWTPRTSTAVFLGYTRMKIDAAGDEHGGVDRSTEIELRARGEVRHRLGADGEAAAGLAVKRADLRFDLDANGFRSPFNSYVAPVQSHFPYAFVDLAGYADLRLPIVARLQVTPGIRVDRQGTTNRIFASPRLNVEYRAREHLRLTGAVGVYRQSMTCIWIGSDVRNATLDPVRSLQTLAGLSARLPATVDLVVEAFDKRYTGYPVDSLEWWHALVDAAADFESPFVGLLRADGTVHARGVDTSVDKRLAGHVDVNASYSLASFNASRYPPYHRLDVRVDRTFAIHGTALIACGEIENVYNRDNVLIYEWSRAGAQPRPGYQWSRLPVGGIRWEF